MGIANDKFGIPLSVTRIVYAEAADYQRREKILSAPDRIKSSFSDIVLEGYARKNKAIKEAVIEAMLNDYELADKMLYSIAKRQGYSFYRYPYISERTFYRMKRKAIRAIAMALFLI